MKKFISIMILAFSLVVMPVKAVSLPKKTDHEKVIINVFRGSGCSHCYEALEYFNQEFSKYSDYIDFRVYETWYDGPNSDLANAVAESLGETLEGVPYFVIGKKSFSGFSESVGKEIIETALKEYQNKNYADTVKKIAKSYTDASYTSLVKACKEEGIVDGKVTIYMFRGTGCAHCHEALEYFYNNSEDILNSKIYNIVTYEVYENSTNGTLGQKVAEKLGTEFTGVPFILVGSHYISGFSEDLIKEIFSYAEEEYNNDDYVDYVIETTKEMEEKPKISTLEKAWEVEKISKSDDTLLIIGIVGILVVVLVTFNLLARKKSNK